MADDKLASKMLHLLEKQMAQQKVGLIRIDDGYVLLFSADTLEHLLESANSSTQKRALIFVRYSESAEITNEDLN